MHVVGACIHCKSEHAEALSRYRLQDAHARLQFLISPWLCTGMQGPGCIHGALSRLQINRPCCQRNNGDNTQQLWNVTNLLHCKAHIVHPRSSQHGFPAMLPSRNTSLRHLALCGALMLRTPKYHLSTSGGYGEATQKHAAAHTRSTSAQHKATGPPTTVQAGWLQECHVIDKEASNSSTLPCDLLQQPQAQQQDLKADESNMALCHAAPSSELWLLHVLLPVAVALRSTLK